jgi:hypothetical protein
MSNLCIIDLDELTQGDELTAVDCREYPVIAGGVKGLGDYGPKQRDLPVLVSGKGDGALKAGCPRS